MAIDKTISILGLGGMGSAIARAYTKAGYKTIVWNRSPAKAHALVADAAVPVASATECIRASPLVITCLLNVEAFQDVLNKADQGAGVGRILIDYTSASPDDITNSQATALKHSFSTYIRGAIETYPAYVGMPESLFYYSGDQKIFASIEETLKILGMAVYLGEDVLFATLQECTLGIFFFGFSQAFLQTMAFYNSTKMYMPGGAQRLLKETLLPIFMQDYSRLYGELARQIDEKDYVSQASDGAPLSVLQDTLGCLIQTSEKLGISSNALHPMYELVQARISQGGAAEEMSSLVETITTRSRSDLL
ncbi:hypothetical protein EYZ11_010230 [Aspergillus tanneri]|uniref:Uncharacterized protein n=1 Tax=Aspergillus tanneri TaxID=1220188 RepID=A0A4V3UN93_9EURO|nr:uncharacterized protein ATNIH1004_010891 [Aspergillus tanneri]KAA8641952.1 hypothetical protein ATNIH1004_010891 [Aspergillus tanneri]THC90314.1 hypothetical protein EYZ11_010230 [Aspergillus tanneri]